MARTIQEIRNQMLSQKDSMPELAIYNSNSNTAVWRLWINFFVFVVYTFERFLDVFKGEVQVIIDSRRIGTLAWYVSVARDFQKGDTLQEFETGDFGYQIIDDTKKIIKRASAKQASGTITLKVAKENGTTSQAEKLADAEKTQFETYMNFVKFAGTRVNYISLDADKLNVICDVWYDGLYVTNIIQDSLQNTINEYLKNLPFDGIVNKNELIEKMRATKGVADIVLTTITGVQGINTTNIVREYETFAGYIVLDNFQITNFNVV
jgi:hypothetical protein